MSHRLLPCLMLALALLPEPLSQAKRSALIALDVGHSKAHPGAVSAQGRTEFEFNAVLASVISKKFAAMQVPVKAIGADGNMQALAERSHLANASGATFLLSIHHDSVQPKYLKPWQWRGLTRWHSGHASGFSLFVSTKNQQFTASLRCASSIGAALRRRDLQPATHHAENIPGESKKWADYANGVYFYDDLVVLKTAAMPAVLLEAGVIVNRDDEAWLQNPANQSLFAAAIAEGLIACGINN